MKAFGFTLLTFFLFSIFVSFIFPPGISLSEHKENKYLDNKIVPGWTAEDEWMLKQLRKNYAIIPNFGAQYSNTILTWFGNRRYLDDHYPEDFINDYYFVKLGSIMPYIIVIALVIIWHTKTNN